MEWSGGIQNRAVLIWFPFHSPPSSSSSDLLDRNTAPVQTEVAVVLYTPHHTHLLFLPLLLFTLTISLTAVDQYSTWLKGEGEEEEEGKGKERERGGEGGGGGGRERGKEGGREEGKEGGKGGEEGKREKGRIKGEMRQLEEQCST